MLLHPVDSALSLQTYHYGLSNPLFSGISQALRQPFAANIHLNQQTALPQFLGSLQSVAVAIFSIPQHQG
jgi:hypothetical protein